MKNGEFSLTIQRKRRIERKRRNARGLYKKYDQFTIERIILIYTTFLRI